MNITLAVCAIISFSFIGEVLTWISRIDRIFVFSYVSLIRILTTCLSICSIHCIDKQYNDYEFLNDTNLFKSELIQHQDSLINYQKTMIYKLSNSLLEKYDYDILQLNIILKDKIDYEEQYIDSLYNIQL